MSFDKRNSVFIVVFESVLESLYLITDHFLSYEVSAESLSFDKLRGLLESLYLTTDHFDATSDVSYSYSEFVTTWSASAATKSEWVPTGKMPDSPHPKWVADFVERDLTFWITRSYLESGGGGNTKQASSGGGTAAARRPSDVTRSPTFKNLVGIVGRPEWFTGLTRYYLAGGGPFGTNVADDGANSVPVLNRDGVTLVIADSHSPDTKNAPAPKDNVMQGVWADVVAVARQKFGPEKVGSGAEYNHMGAAQRRLKKPPLTTAGAQETTSATASQQRVEVCAPALGGSDGASECLTLQESVWGIKLLAELEGLKATVDPERLLRCFACVGEGGARLSLAGADEDGGGGGSLPSILIAVVVVVVAITIVVVVVILYCLKETGETDDLLEDESSEEYDY